MISNAVQSGDKLFRFDELGGAIPRGLSSIRYTDCDCRAMLPLDDNRWGELRGGYKTAYDPRPALTRLVAKRNADEVWSELWNELHHQGDVGTASFAAVPHLVEDYRNRHTPDWNTYAIVFTIEEARLRSGPEIPGFLSEGYFQSLRQLSQLAIQELDEVDDPTIVKSAMSIIAITKKLIAVGRLLGSYTEDELTEMEETYLRS